MKGTGGFYEEPYKYCRLWNVRESGYVFVTNNNPDTWKLEETLLSVELTFIVVMPSLRLLKQSSLHNARFFSLLFGYFVLLSGSGWKVYWNECSRNKGRWNLYWNECCFLLVTTQRYLDTNTATFYWVFGGRNGSLWNGIKYRKQTTTKWEAFSNFLMFIRN